MTATIAELDPALRWERIYVATVFAMPSAYDRARVPLDDLGSAPLRAILECVLALHQSGRRVSRAAMRAELERTGRVALVGALDHLGEIEPDLESVAARVREHASLRRLRRDTATLTAALARSDLAAAREAIGALSLAHDTAADRDPVMALGQLLAHAVEAIQQASREQTDGGLVQLPIPTAERLTLVPGTLLTLGAQTNVGKSSASAHGSCAWRDAASRSVS